MADYCTNWPDGWPWGTGAEWAHCCRDHDAFYRVNEGWSGYLDAHYGLYLCVAEVSSMMAGAMFAGLCTVGWFYLIHAKNRLTKGAKKDNRNG